MIPKHQRIRAILDSTYNYWAVHMLSAGAKDLRYRILMILSRKNLGLKAIGNTPKRREEMRRNLHRVIQILDE
jgi:hypothetical protein